MFQAGAPVEGQDFIGRSAEIARVISAMQSGNNISIYGMARVGKSSIVKEIIRRAKSSNLFQKVPLFFEYRLTQDKNIRFHFFEDLKDFILDKTEEYGEEENSDIQSLKRLISRVEKGLENKEVNHERYIRMCDKLTTLYDNDLWIIIDEMDYANSAFGDYIQKIREIVNSSDRVHIINISRHSLSSIFPINGNGSNYPGIVSQNIPIVGFSEEDMASFKETFAAAIGNETAEAIWDSMIQYAGNIPYFLALLANGIMENKDVSLADIAENPYGKYMETLNQWYQALYSDNMLENAMKYIANPQQAEAKNLRVFGIVQGETFAVPWFAEYIQKQNTAEQTSGLLGAYVEFQTKIHILLEQGNKILQGIMRDRETLKNVNVSLGELEAMNIKIECMKTLRDKNTFVRILPSVEEINTFDTKIRNINDLFERLS